MLIQNELYERISWYGARLLKDIDYNGFFDAIYVETPDDKDFIVEYNSKEPYKNYNLDNNQYPNPRLGDIIDWLRDEKEIDIKVYYSEEHKSYMYDISYYKDYQMMDNRISESKYDFESSYLAYHRAVLMAITIYKDILLYEIDYMKENNKEVLKKVLMEK
jgi:hypothetical protein